MRASAARSFREVIDTFRVPPNLGLTRDAFLNLDEKSRNTAKQVPFFVAACFRESPSKRIFEQATHCNLIFLDIDPEKKKENGKWVETGRYPAAPFIKDPENLYRALEGFNFAAHVTASSTPERPRMRVVVDAEAIPLSAYPRAVMAVAALLGLPTITRESKVAVQPMFLPVVFSDSTEEEHPLTAYSMEGRTFSMNDIGEGLFPEFDVKQPGASPGMDALDFLRAPVPEITLITAREALFNIDPDCSRDEWLNHAAALKHQFFPAKEEEAFALFDEWSAQGTKYGGEEETRALWSSLRQTPLGRAPVTIRTLLRHAVENGWDDGKVKETCFNRLVRWMEEDVPTITELMEKGVQKILATPLLSAVQEDVLVYQLCTQAKKRFAYTISATAIRKDIARTKLEIKAAEKTTEKTREPLWTKSVCYVANTHEFYRRRTGEKYRPDNFNAMYSRWLLPSEESLRESGQPITPATLARPIVSPTDYALNHIKISTVYDYAYDPSQPTEVFFVERGRKYVNKYSPTYPELDYKNAGKAGYLFETHLRHLIAEEEYRHLITDFLAYMVQYPGRKIRWATFIQSAEGGGKTFFAEVMKAVLGAEHVTVVSGENIKSGYNEWCFGHQLVVVEEVRAAGANRYEIMNGLKPLITNDGVSINEKFRNHREVKNISNYMMFSNHHDALALNSSDRRYFVIKSPIQTKAQVLALGETYFPTLYAMLREMPGAMRAYLDGWEITPGFAPDGHAPRTKYVQDLINDSATDVTAAIRRLLLEGDYPLIQYDIVSTKALMDVMRIDEGLQRITAQAISQVLRDEGLHQIGRHQIGTERHYLWGRAGIDAETAVALATDRVKRGLKNLCMELIY